MGLTAERSFLMIERRGVIKMVPVSEEDSVKRTGPGFVDREKMIKIIVLIGIAGIALIFGSSIMGSINSNKNNEEISNTIPPDTDISDEYKQNLCEELGNMIASIEGTGRTKVMITLGGTIRNIYATDNDCQQRESIKNNGKDDVTDSQNTEKKTCIVVKRKDGSEEALILGRSMPSVSGVLVVCDGGGDTRICDKVTKAVSAALNISQSRICVTKMGS